MQYIVVVARFDVDVFATQQLTTVEAFYTMTTQPVTNVFSPIVVLPYNVTG